MAVHRRRSTVFPWNLRRALIMVTHTHMIICSKKYIKNPREVATCIIEASYQTKGVVKLSQGFSWFMFRLFLFLLLSHWRWFNWIICVLSELDLVTLYKLRLSESKYEKSLRVGKWREGKEWKKNHEEKLEDSLLSFLKAVHTVH
jgi:hypothetical protein